MKIINIHIMKKITFSILFVWLSLSLWAARQPEFSTAGFFRLDNSGREVYSMNPAWRFHKGAVESAETKEFNDNLRIDNYISCSYMFCFSGYVI